MCGKILLWFDRACKGLGSADKRHRWNLIKRFSSFQSNEGEQELLLMLQTFPQVTSPP